MKNQRFELIAKGFISILLLSIFSCQSSTKRNTTISINGNQFLINGDLTYKGRYWKDYKIEGLLFNSRMVQGIFDDLNPETRGRFKYPDTQEWDPERNTKEFIAAMPSWYEHGLLGFTINLQGGSPMGYGNKNWINSAFDEKGELRPAYMARLEKILDKADELGMVVILGYFYFGQDQNLQDEQAVINAVDNATRWLFDKGYKNVIIEVANECNNRAYDRDIIKQHRVHELINRIKEVNSDGYRLLVGVSFNGNTLPPPNVVKVSDFILIHGNGVKKPERIMEMVTQTKEIEGYTNIPIIFNEDDHYDFDKDTCNMTAAIMSYASWGFFDFRREGEAFENGFQSVPVDWRINSERKKAFFEKVREVTGK